MDSMVHGRFTGRFGSRLGHVSRVTIGSDYWPPARVRLSHKGAGTDPENIEQFPPCNTPA